MWNIYVIIPFLNEGISVNPGRRFIVTSRSNHDDKPIMIVIIGNNFAERPYMLLYLRLVIVFLNLPYCENAITWKWLVMTGHISSTSIIIIKDIEWDFYPKWS